MESDEFERSKNTAFELYTKYQTKVHHDPPSDLSEFVDFLCNSPIKVSQIFSIPPVLLRVGQLCVKCLMFDLYELLLHDVGRETERNERIII